METAVNETGSKAKTAKQNKPFSVYCDEVTTKVGTWEEMSKELIEIGKRVNCKIVATPSFCKGHVQRRLASDKYKQLYEGLKLTDKGIVSSKKK